MIRHAFFSVMFVKDATFLKSVLQCDDHAGMEETWRTVIGS